MYYLVTGTNGAGKTLNALKWCRELQLEDPSRSVFYNGFDINPEFAKEFNWKPFDPKEWENLPDGSICIMDECQKYFPNRPTGSRVPDYVMALTEHRKRGFDFFMITQHPGNIDSFIRKLIGSPSWHRHLKRPFGQDRVNCIEWTYCHASPEKPNSGRDGQSKMIPFPTEVYDWYVSAEKHTAKKTIPKKLIVLIVSLILILALIVIAYFSITSIKTSEEEPITESVKETVVSQRSPAPRRTEQSDSNNIVTTEEYINSYKPRINDFAYTAPRYDEITKPVTAPYPAACVDSERFGCKCYSQQGTILKVKQDTCLSIIKDGYFIDWDTQPQSKSEETS